MDQAEGLGMSRPISTVEGPFKELFAFDDDYCLLHFKDVDLYEDEGGSFQHAARACNIISAHFFGKLSDPLTWTQISASPALQPFRADWLSQRWQHLVYSHVLSEHGAPTHFVDLVSLEGNIIDFYDGARQPSFLKILKFPELAVSQHTLSGQDVSYYKSSFGSKERRVIPLKVRFHLKLEPGSQLAQRLQQQPTEGANLGLESIPKPGELFQRPVLEFYTKAEAIERLLNLQEALLVSGLTAGQFDEMVEFAYCVALALFALLQQKGLNLDDGFLEFGSTADGIMLLNTLSPLDMTLVQREPILGMLQSTTDPAVADERWGALCNQILGHHVFIDCPERL
jgi:phosphoribosylaminoimidazole-succinocarboxamide synthase